MNAAAPSLILAIETSCDETAIAVVRNGREVLSSVVASQHDLHAKFGGVVPEVASRAHIERILPVLRQALQEAEVDLKALDAIAVGNRPGLIGSLLVGVTAAKTLAWSLGKPLIGVDHVQAHLAAGALGGDPLKYPALGLVVSGGHTSLYTVESPLRMSVMGRTIDDAVGEAYDKVASIMNLGFPGGPALDKLAQGVDPGSEHFPRTLLGPDSLDFSYSGLKTAVLYRVCGIPKGRGAASQFERSAQALSEREKACIAAAFQEAAVDVLLTKMDRALGRLEAEGRPPQSLIIGGGVSANSALRDKSLAFGRERGLDVRLPQMAYCIDNAAMIAALAHHKFTAGLFDDLGLEAAASSLPAG